MKSRAVFTPEGGDGIPRGRQGGRKPSGIRAGGGGAATAAGRGRGRGRGRPRKGGGRRRIGLKDLLEDEEAPHAGGAGSDANRYKHVQDFPVFRVCVCVCVFFVSVCMRDYPAVVSLQSQVVLLYTRPWM